MARILLDDVSLTFRLRTTPRRTSLKEYVVNHLFRRSDAAPMRKVDALSHISLDIREGDRIGLVGHNGAGKSTMLRLLAGIYVPSQGRRFVEGRVSSMLDIGLGIEAEASGWENIKFRGYIQRQTPKQLARLVPEIAEFSELGGFLDAPVRCYSSGMTVRLVFSIATAIEPEILLVDEVFSAGDIGFQEKSTRRMKKLLEKARILVMATHDLRTMSEVCEKAVWLDHGTIRQIGPAAQVAAAYEDHMRGLARAA